MSDDLLTFSDGEGTARRRRRRGNTVGCVTAIFLVVVVVVVVLGAIVGLQAWQVYGQLKSAGDQFAALQTQISDSPSRAQDSTLPALQEELADARETMDGTTMQVARTVPWVGPNVVAVTNVTYALDQLATEALPPIVAASTVIDPETGELREGSDDPAALLSSVSTAMGVLEDAPDAIAVVSRVSEDLEAIDTSELQPQVADSVVQVRDQVAELNEKIAPYQTAFNELSQAEEGLGESGDAAQELLDRLRG